MAKKSTSRKSIIELWPGPFTAAHAMIALSLMLNVALFAVLIALAQTNVFDKQIASRGAEILCSQEYRESASTQDAKALLDYSCNANKSGEFFRDGYNAYRESIGLKPVSD